MKIAAFFSPYLNIFGGAEKYLLDIALELKKIGYKTEFFWPDKTIKERLVHHYGSKYNFIQINSNWHQSNPIQKLIITKKFQCFFYHSDGSYFYSLAKHSYTLLQVPNPKLMPNNNWLSQLKFSCWQPIYNSNFTKRFFNKAGLEKPGAVLYPIALEPKTLELKQKEKIILSVGRFFSHLHSKRQDFLIQAFLSAQVKYPIFKTYKLVLIGSFKTEDKQYLNKLKKIIGKNTNIILKTNSTKLELDENYKKAQFCWHAAGYGSDEKKEPEKQEHFGISIVEAMANGCIPLVYKAGGPKEIVIDKHTGILYSKRIELIKQTYRLIKNKKEREKMSLATYKRAFDKFSTKQFSFKLQTIINK